MHSHNSKSRDRIIESSLRAPSRTARRACVGGAIAFGAALPLLVGALQTYGQGVDAATQSLLAPTADFTKPEAGEEKPGGGATSRGSTNTANAFSLSSGNMDFKRELNFKIGNAIFRKNWVSAPSSTDASDGLGPAVQFPRLPELPFEGRPRPSAVLGRRAGRFRLDAGQALGPAGDATRRRRSSRRIA